MSRPPVRKLAAHLAVLAVVGTCVNLGLWQLRRLEERRRLNAIVLQRSRLPPLPVESADLPYQRVVAEGTYDAAREVVVRGRELAGQPGNHLLTPLRLASGGAVLVDRGWVPVDWDRQASRPPEGSVRVVGVLLPSERRPPLSPPLPATGTLREVPRIDVRRLARQLPYPLHPLYLLAESQHPPQDLPRPVPLPPPSEGPHLSYAVQWFLFAAVAAGGYAALLRSRRAPSGH